MPKTPGRTPAENGIPRIAALTYAAAEPFHCQLMDIAEAGLAGHGFVDGETCVLQRWFGNRDIERTLSLAKEIVEWRPDVILSFMTNADLALLDVTREYPIPIVCWSMDPVGGGLVANPQRPERNLTGVTFAHPLPAAQLEVLRAIRPAARKVAMLHNPTYAIAPAALAHLRHAAAPLAIEIQEFECLTLKEIDGAFDAMRQAGIDAAIIGPHELFNANGPAINRAADTNSVAVVGLLSIAESGGPAGFLPDFEHVWTSCAAIATEVLRGRKIADLPFQRIITPLLGVNREALRRLGASDGDRLIERADWVF